MLTTLYAVPLAIIYLILTIRVIRYRRQNKIGLGDNGDKGLIKRMRAQANFVETAPLGLILLILFEMGQTAHWPIHLIGALLVVGRVCHGIGFSLRPPNMNLRVAGTVMTLTSIGGCAFALVMQAVLS